MNSFQFQQADERPTERPTKHPHDDTSGGGRPAKKLKGSYEFLEAHVAHLAQQVNQRSDDFALRQQHDERWIRNKRSTPSKGAEVVYVMDSQSNQPRMILKIGKHVMDRYLEGSLASKDAPLASNNEHSVSNEADHSQSPSTNPPQISPPPRRKAQPKKKASTPYSDRDYTSSYTPQLASELRRSTRTLAQTEPVVAAPTEQKPAKAKKPLELDVNEGFMPSAENDYRFKYDSPSGRTAAELDKLLKPPTRPAKFPQELLAEKKGTWPPKSYKNLGSRPKPGLADWLVQQMEEDQVVRTRLWAEQDGQLPKCNLKLILKPEKKPE